MPAPPAERDRPLLARFGESLALVRCEDEPPLRLLESLLRHCQVPVGEDLADPALVYRIEATRRSGYRLLRGDALVGEGLDAPTAVEWLVHDLTLALAVASRGRLALHAAGLARGERGLILCGESGSGKSTLATRLVAAGLDFLSDELVAVAPDAGEMVGFPRLISLKPGAAAWPAWLPEPAARVRTSHPDGAVHLDPETLRPGCVRARARPAALVFPRYSASAPPTLRPLSRAEAAYQLMPRLLNFAAWPDRGLRLVAQLASKLTAYSLVYADSARAVARVEAALAQASESTSACSSTV